MNNKTLKEFQGMHDREEFIKSLHGLRGNLSLSDTGLDDYLCDLINGKPGDEFKHLQTHYLFMDILVFERVSTLYYMYL